MVSNTNFEHNHSQKKYRKWNSFDILSDSALIFMNMSKLFIDPISHMRNRSKIYASLVKSMSIEVCSEVLFSFAPDDVKEAAKRLKIISGSNSGSIENQEIDQIKSEINKEFEAKKKSYIDKYLKNQLSKTNISLDQDMILLGAYIECLNDFFSLEKVNIEKNKLCEISLKKKKKNPENEHLSEKDSIINIKFNFQNIFKKIEENYKKMSENEAKLYEKSVNTFFGNTLFFALTLSVANAFFDSWKMQLVKLLGFNIVNPYVRFIGLFFEMFLILMFHQAVSSPIEYIFKRQIEYIFKRQGEKRGLRESEENLLDAINKLKDHSLNPYYIFTELFNDLRNDSIFMGLFDSFDNQKIQEQEIADSIETTLQKAQSFETNTKELKKALVEIEEIIKKYNNHKKDDKNEEHNTKKSLDEFAKKYGKDDFLSIISLCKEKNIKIRVVILNFITEMYQDFNLLGKEDSNQITKL